jgi:hypothetical protein
MRRWFEALILRLSFALAEDAARFCEVVRATPDKSYGDRASMAFFNYDAGLYNELSGAFTTRGLARLKPPMREASSWSMSLVWGPAMMPAGSTTTRSRLSWPTMNFAKTSLLPSWREFVWGHREDADTQSQELGASAIEQRITALEVFGVLAHASIYGTGPARRLLAWSGSRPMGIPSGNELIETPSPSVCQIDGGTGNS